MSLVGLDLTLEHEQVSLALHHAVLPVPPINDLVLEGEETQSVTHAFPTNIAVSYLAFILSTIYAPSCKWKMKYQMLLATAMYTLNYSTGLIIPHVSTPFKFLTGAIGSGGAGLSAGLLWVSQGRYIHLVCEKAAVPERKGEMFGLFSLLYCLSHISAGLITTFGLGLFSPQVYFICLATTGLLAVAFCALVIGHIEDQPTLPRLEP